MQHATGVKFDAGKAPMSLLDRTALEQIAQVMAFGAQKYGRDNWRGGIQMTRLLDAAMRHLYAYADGETNDPESGLSHLAHAGCCVMFALNMAASRPDLDDRRAAVAAEIAARLSPAIVAGSAEYRAMECSGSK